MDEGYGGSPSGGGRLVDSFDEALLSLRRGLNALERDLESFKRQLSSHEGELSKRQLEQDDFIESLREAEAKVRRAREESDRQADMLLAEIESRVDEMRRTVELVRSTSRAFHEALQDALRPRAGEPPPPPPPGELPRREPIVVPDTPTAVPALGGRPRGSRRVITFEAVPAPSREGVSALVRRLAALPGVAGIRVSEIGSSRVTFALDLDRDRLDISGLLAEGAEIAQADAEHIVVRLPD